jgi:tRNA (mo5U34)-methyltransferase
MTQLKDVIAATVATATTDEIRRLVDSKPWFHRFKLIDDIITPGLYFVDGPAWVERTFPGLDLSGKRVLEIGTWDGPYAFALEARGAIVDATDIQDPDRTGFNVAKYVLNSRVRYTCTSVYEVEKHFPPEEFDYILFLGVFYHLKYPVLALEALARLLRSDGRLYFEGECLLNYASRADGRTPNLLDRITLHSMARSNYPVSVYYSGPFKDDPSNWHVPNVACLNEWMKTAGLHIHSQVLEKMGRGTSKFPTQRVSGFAVKTGRVHDEHPMVETIADDLARLKVAAARRTRQMTFRKAAALTVNACLHPLGLQRNGYRITRADRH